MRQLWILGGGGHAKSVIDAARSSAEYEVVGVLDDKEISLGTAVSGVPVRGPITIEAIRDLRVDLAVIAIGNNRIRAAIAKSFDGMIAWATVLHSVAYVAPDVRLGHGTVICAGAVVQPASVIGRHVIANTSCSIGHDCLLGDFVHVGPGVNLAGGVRIGSGALMGIGSRAVPMCSIGTWSTVGAGGVVTSDIPDGVTAVGTPARVVEAKPVNAKRDRE